MFSKQSGNSELFPWLYLFLVWIFWRENITFGRGKKYIHQRNCEQVLDKKSSTFSYLYILNIPKIKCEKIGGEYSLVDFCTSALRKALKIDLPYSKRADGQFFQECIIAKVCEIIFTWFLSLYKVNFFSFEAFCQIFLGFS